MWRYVGIVIGVAALVNGVQIEPWVAVLVSATLIVVGVRRVVRARRAER